jgi:hypothetical protein
MTTTSSTQVPDASTFTTAPLRHRLELALDAAPAEVWALVGAHERLPEYSAGIERVDVTSDSRVCHFRPFDGAEPGLVLREYIRWQAPNVGYAAIAESPNAFGLENDLSIVSIAPTAHGTTFTWEQHYDHPDLPAMRASFGEGLADIGERLVVRFGGRVVGRFVDG